jgi:hypothetical protein
MRRGLIRRTPAFEFFDQCFAEFVRRAEPARDIVAWEREGDSGWRRVQIPFVVAIVVVIGFFFLTQPEAYSVGLALIGALTTVLPRVLQMAGFFGRGTDTPQNG